MIWWDIHEWSIEIFITSIFNLEFKENNENHMICYYVYQLTGLVLFSAHVYGSFGDPCSMQGRKYSPLLTVCLCNRSFYRVGWSAYDLFYIHILLLIVNTILEVLNDNKWFWEEPGWIHIPRVQGHPGQSVIKYVNEVLNRCWWIWKLFNFSCMSSPCSASLLPTSLALW